MAPPLPDREPDLPQVDEPATGGDLHLLRGPADGGELPEDVAADEARLAHPGVADDAHLDLVVRDPGIDVGGGGDGNGILRVE